MKLLKIGSIIAILSLTLALAQTLTGNYILQDDIVKLVLEQQPSGLLIGELSGNGLSFELEGRLSPDDPNTAYGYLYTDKDQYLFAVVLEEPVLNMILFSILESGEANPEDSQTYIFERVNDNSPETGEPQDKTPAANSNAEAANTSTTDNSTSKPTTATANRLPTSNTATTMPSTNSETEDDAKQNQTNGNPLSAKPVSTGSPSQNPLVIADPFVGTFEGDGIKLVLIKTGTNYSGRLDFKGNSYPLTALKKGSGLVGNFKVGDKLFSFSAALDNNKLTLVSDGAIYPLIKK